MNYNQLQFWLLFACLLPYWWLPHRYQNRLLLVVSYVFYGFWDYRFLFLVLLSTAIDYVGGLGVAGVELGRRALLMLGALLVAGALVLVGPVCAAGMLGAIVVYGLGYRRLMSLAPARRRKVFLILSMVSNLAILAFFKYCDFFISSFSDLLLSVGVIDSPAPVLGILLPAGISFYTFQAMSYTIDIYRNELEPTRRFDDFALFVCFFPHLVAGPIMRAHSLLPQVIAPRTTKPGDFEEGLLLVLIGLVKKVAIADNVAPIANAVFERLESGDTSELSGAMVIVGVYAFAIQIYGDFSGYSSIARGISKWLGFELVINFRQPYLATSPSDFWRRWHISLSSWLRDYLYIPLGGNRRGVAFEYRNLLLTMLLGGLWHGASWTFVAWGLFHGVILCVFKVARIADVDPTASPVRWLLRVVIMFHITCFGWLLFRADSFGSVALALELIVTNLQPSVLVSAALLLMLFFAGPTFALELFTKGEEQLRRLFGLPVLVQSAVYIYLLFMIVVLASGRTYEFIYFQF